MRTANGARKTPCSHEYRRTLKTETYEHKRKTTKVTTHFLTQCSRLGRGERYHPFNLIWGYQSELKESEVKNYDRKNN